MPDPRETLARIRAQAENASEGPWTASLDRVEHAGGSEYAVAYDVAREQDAEFVAAARTTVPALLDALDAVLELHKPIQASMTSNGGVSDVTVCDHCLNPEWPCPTVEAITTALEGDDR